MDDKKRAVGPTFFAMGLVFLAIALVQQGFALTFGSGIFNLGVMFTLSGIVASALDRRSQKR